MQFVLASTSPFRRQLLERLGLPFITATPDVDESPLEDESPAHIVARLAEAKARAVAQQYPNALIIGSDQTAHVGGTLLNKPGTHDNAVQQLRRCSGHAVTFQTGLCLLNAARGNMQINVIPYYVHFRKLADAQIENYLRREQPYQCAGSFKSEGLGIALFERLVGEDPTALVGLPLIELTRMLSRENVSVL